MIFNLINNLINLNNELYYSTIEKQIYKFQSRKNQSKYKKFQNDFISIYTPTKNRSKILHDRAIKGILGQTYKNFEYIIIGDYCNDDTKEMISKINDKRIRYLDLREEGIKYKKLNKLKDRWCRGASIPSNFAFKLCKGKWIARCDDDEEWTPNFLETSINFAYKNNLEFVSSRSINKDNNIAEKTHKLYSDYFNTKKYLKGNNPSVGAPSTWVMRSYLKLFKMNENCWRKKWNQVMDADLFYRMAYCRVNCGFIDKKMVYQLPRPGNDAIGFLGAQNDYDNFY